MIVIFISECEKNSLKKTRQVLDAFADRIGHKTWKTVITDEGLKAVKKLLSRTASKNTAVSCHWIRSRSSTELLWIAGNRSKFNSQGLVPVNFTQKNIINSQWENDWHYMPLIQSLAAIAGLFHDFGKSSLWFQDKLKKAVEPKQSGNSKQSSSSQQSGRAGNYNKYISDPLRHEWISCLILKAFIIDELRTIKENAPTDKEKINNLASVKENGINYSESVVNDTHWLSCLSADGIDETSLKNRLTDISQSEMDLKKISTLPDAAKLIAWLILSHHKLPLIKDHNILSNLHNNPAESLDYIFNIITKEWGYENFYDDKKEYQTNLKKCFEFPQGFPSESEQWQKQIKKWSSKMLNALPLLEKAINDGSWRLILHYARLSLMVGDHYFSSQPFNPKWHSSLNLFANTGKHFANTGKVFGAANKNLVNTGNIFFGTSKNIPISPAKNETILKQKLDEHLMGVAQNSLQTAYLLPAFESQLPFVEDAKELKKRSSSDSKYKWQDKAVDKIKNWQIEASIDQQIAKKQQLESKLSTSSSLTSKSSAAELFKMEEEILLGKPSLEEINDSIKNNLKIKSFEGFEIESSLTDSANVNRYGFFAVNMASTGCGKTFANAKVMQALSNDGKSLRYILALGLRTLTLQTGDEYRERIHLDETELAVVIGSKAVKELHKYNKISAAGISKESRDRESQQNQHDYNDSDSDYDYEQSGSESMENLLDEDVHYEGTIPETNLTTILKSEKERKFLYAPVLVCTIDHLMSATETKRGGRYMLPALRLLSSDLVIDEIDDFNGNDLIAIGRLIHLAGMSGRKVMISSATIPPDLAEGYFNAYKEGFNLYSKTRDVKKIIGCCWIDEFTTKVESIVIKSITENLDYQQLHQVFINKRVEKLKKETVKRKAEIVECQDIISVFSSISDTSNSELTYEQAYFEKIKDAIIEKHLEHNTIYTSNSDKNSSPQKDSSLQKNSSPQKNSSLQENNNSQKKISFGVVRAAHIKTCIKLAKYLIESDWHKDFDPKIMAYHSRQVLLLRSEQEKHLDQVLKRKEKNGEMPEAFNNRVILNHIKSSNSQNIIFILAATPVEEVGRDHDFDWAVVEPSSFRSIIQLSGRVMRHRDPSFYDISNKKPNIALMQYNLKALEYAVKNINSNKTSILKPAYCNPGYEGLIEQGGKKFNLLTHDLKKLVNEKMINQRIDAVPRINRSKDLIELKSTADKQLADLEHYVMHNLLTMYDKAGPESMQGWLTQNWQLTALPQSLTEFRKSRPEIKLHLVYEDSDYSYSDKSLDASKLQFMEKNSRGGYSPVEKIYRINKEEIDINIKNRLWLQRDYLSLLEDIEHKRGISVREASIKYGEISFPDHNYDNRQPAYIYSDQFGLQEKKE